jgi:hypothetical protein
MTLRNSPLKTSEEPHWSLDERINDWFISFFFIFGLVAWPINMMILSLKAGLWWFGLPFFVAGGVMLYLGGAGYLWYAAFGVITIGLQLFLLQTKKPRRGGSSAG